MWVSGIPRRLHQGMELNIDGREVHHLPAARIVLQIYARDQSSTWHMINHLFGSNLTIPQSGYTLRLTHIAGLTPMPALSMLWPNAFRTSPDCAVVATVSYIPGDRSHQ